MALLGGLSRLFGGRRGNDAASRNGVHREPPVVIDLSDEDAIDPDSGLDSGLNPGPISEMKLLPAPKSRQEFMYELQRNYSEVLEVVRKVDRHLDDQRVRQERLLELAERLPGAMDELPKLREQNQRLNLAIEKLTDATLRGQNRQDASMTKQRETLDAVRDHAARSASAGDRMAESLAEMGQGMSRVSDASDQLGDAISTLQEREAAQNRAVVDAVQRQQRLIVLVAAVAAVSGVATLAAVGLLAAGVL